MCRQQNVSLAGGFSFRCIWKRGGDLGAQGDDMRHRGDELGERGDDMWHRWDELGERGEDMWYRGDELGVLAVANKQAVGQKPDVCLESAPPLFYR